MYKEINWNVDLNSNWKEYFKRQNTIYVNYKLTVQEIYYYYFNTNKILCIIHAQKIVYLCVYLFIYLHTPVMH